MLIHVVPNNVTSLLLIFIQQSSTLKESEERNRELRTQIEILQNRVREVDCVKEMTIDNRQKPFGL